MLQQIRNDLCNGVKLTDSTGTQCGINVVVEIRPKCRALSKEFRDLECLREELTMRVASNRSFYLSDLMDHEDEADESDHEPTDCANPLRSLCPVCSHAPSSILPTEKRRPGPFSLFNARVAL